jgi:hypothetical protein
MHYSIGWIYGVYLGKGSMYIHWSLRKSWLYEKNFGTFFHFCEQHVWVLQQKYLPLTGVTICMLNLAKNMHILCDEP